MKTLTLTNEAYERLKDWKTATNDSFSAVVLRMVPKRGTLGEMIEGFRQLPPLTEQQADVMAEVVAWSNEWDSVAEIDQPWPATLTPAADAA